MLSLFFVVLWKLIEHFRLRSLITIFHSIDHLAPTQPPSNVKVTLIEEDTALVSWKLPDEPNVAVTHYTVLYASRNTWAAGKWQMLRKEGKQHRLKMF